MSTYFRLLGFLRPHLGVFGVAVACMAASSLLKGLELATLIPLADRIVTDKSIPSPGWLPGWLASAVGWLNGLAPMTVLTGFALAIPILFLLKGLFEFWQTFYINDATQRVIRDLRQTLFNRLTTLSLDYHQKQTTGKTMSRILYDTGVIQNTVTEGFYDLIYQSFQVVIFLGLALAINWRFAFLLFVLAPLIAWPMIQIGKALKKISHRAQAVMGELSSGILEPIAGMEVVQAFRLESAVQQKFAATNEQLYRIFRKLQKRINFLSPLTEAVGAVAGAVVFWVGGRAVLQGEWSLGTFLVFLGAILSLLHPFKRLSRLHSIAQQALAAGERIFEVLDTPPSVVEHARARVLPPLQREIVYEHVSFHYDSQPVLRGVSLTIPKGEILAIVGPSGGGKTTLVNLLPRFFDPYAGRVKIDGIDLKHVTLASLRGQIGLVTQETVLFNDTVRANIAIGRPEASFEAVVEAAKAANAHRFISRLPKGYDTVIGERGDSLSGGERQRLALARVFLLNPSILILDEATSQLDAESEHLVSEALETVCRGRTVLLVAHRLSTVRIAHRIVLLQEGRIVESGRHDELLQKSPLYRRFCELQLIPAGSSSKPQGRKES
jgi:subfamily B ATP-binding cassette protein MsbA